MSSAATRVVGVVDAAYDDLAAGLKDEILRREREIVRRGRDAGRAELAVHRAVGIEADDARLAVDVGEDEVLAVRLSQHGVNRRRAAKRDGGDATGAERLVKVPRGIEADDRDRTGGCEVDAGNDDTTAAIGNGASNDVQVGRLRDAARPKAVVQTTGGGEPHDVVRRSAADVNPGRHQRFAIRLKVEVDRGGDREGLRADREIGKRRPGAVAVRGVERAIGIQTSDRDRRTKVSLARKQQLAVRLNGQPAGGILHADVRQHGRPAVAEARVEVAGGHEHAVLERLHEHDLATRGDGRRTTTRVLPR